jgi:hypothetical protein
MKHKPAFVASADPFASPTGATVVAGHMGNNQNGIGDLT